MDNPYNHLPDQAFWKTAVAQREPLQISRLWRPKHPLLPAEKVSTAGSCFAQHIGRALQARGFHWFDGEPAPGVVPEAVRKEYGYELFSFRTGNIYTAALLEQWVSWALGITRPPDEIFIKEGRYYDPFRPAIEPTGFRDREELLASRETTLRAIRHVIETSSVFVFTLGLTEGWRHQSGGYEYPMCPGTVAGEFDPSEHVFKNYDYNEILQSMQRFMEMARQVNPKLRFLLTVSPVPLTATASGEHVLTATTYSKSVLRAVAGDLAKAADVDYFPSYEMITTAPFRGMFYQPNLRSVKPEGVAFVMNSFFDCLHTCHPEVMGAKAVPIAPPPTQVAATPTPSADDVVCEEMLLEAFAKTNTP